MPHFYSFYLTIIFKSNIRNLTFADKNGRTLRPAFKEKMELLTCKYMSISSDNTANRVIVWLRVVIHQFFFDHTGCRIRTVIMFISAKVAQEVRHVFKEFRKSVSPTKRHDQLVVDNRRGGYNSRFLVSALIEWRALTFHFVSDCLFEDCAAIV